MKVVLVPVKELAHAKRRMAPWLSRRERMGLAWAMLEDVGRALAGARTPDKVVVAGRDPELAAFAARRRWEFVRERRQSSESRSVDECAARLRRQGAACVLRVPLDVPSSRRGTSTACWAGLCMRRPRFWSPRETAGAPTPC